jgi:kumamolisin
MKKFDNSILENLQIGDSQHGKISHPEQSHLEKEMTISFHFDLPQDKQELLKERVEKGDVLTFDELKTFSPDQKEVDNLIDWLNKNGFTDVKKSNDLCNVYATSTAQNVQTKLSCDIVTVDDETTVHVASKNAPSLPAEISNNIHSINGLQPFRMPKKRNTKHDKIQSWKKIGKAQAQKLIVGPPYLVNNVLTAYNGIGMTYSGTNQTIAILIDTVPYNSDLTKFWTSNSVNTNLTRVNKINVRNVNLPAPSGEESLDVQWTSGIAPNATINVYASGNLYFTSLDTALDRIISDAGTNTTIKQLSISLGLGELQMSSGELTTENNKFLRLRALGVNTFVSSGDNGSNPAGLQVEYFASDPNVVGVGGTSLKLTGTASVSSETGWSGSGGGVSVKFTKPSWQSTLSGSGRLVPDVSAPADPNYGAYVVLSGYVYQIGGTSWSAPVWAGICALINEARIKAGKSTLPFLPTVLYGYIGTSSFRDITSGSNGRYSAKVGYDQVTGIGTPNIKNLITRLLTV